MSFKWKERNVKTGKIENVKKKIHASVRKVLWHGIGDFVWASARDGGEVCGSHEIFSERESGKKNVTFGDT